MALTEGELQTSIDALVRAIARGELTVEYADRRVTYRSIAELRMALAVLRGELATTQASTASTTQSFASFTRD